MPDRPEVNSPAAPIVRDRRKNKTGARRALTTTKQQAWSTLSLTPDNKLFFQRAIRGRNADCIPEVSTRRRSYTGSINATAIVYRKYQTGNTIPEKLW
jgi:hypothetical protein